MMWSFYGDVLDKLLEDLGSMLVIHITVYMHIAISGAVINTILGYIFVLELCKLPVHICKE